MSCKDPWNFEECFRDDFGVSLAKNMDKELTNILITEVDSDDNVTYTVGPTNPEWVHIVPPVETAHEGVSTVHINGKEYLLVDNSGPEELDPRVLQKDIVRLNAAVAHYENQEHNRLQQNLDIMNRTETLIQEAGKSQRMSFDEMADVFVRSPYETCTYMGGGNEYLMVNEFNLVGVSLVSNPEPGCEIKLVSSEEERYNNAMKIIG